MNDILLCADPLAENFNPSTPAPPELSAWLYLFHSYLQLEEVYLETMEWLNCKGIAPRSHSIGEELPNSCGLSALLSFIKGQQHLADETQTKKLGSALRTHI